MSAGFQTTIASIQSLPELTDLVRREWSMMKEFLPRQAKQLYNSEFVGAGQGNTKIINEFDGNTFADVKPEGVNSSKARVGVGYNKTMTARTFSKEIEITLEMRHDNRYAEVGQMITDLAQFCENRQDLDLTHRLTFATSSSYTDMNGNVVDLTMGDGNPLLYSAHTLAFSSTTYSNIISGNPAFSQGGFEAGLLLGNSQTYNNFGEQRNIELSHIVTWRDPGTMRVVKQFLNSMADIDAVQSGIVNVYKNGYTHVVLPYLATLANGTYDGTKRRWWFLIAPGMKGWQSYVGDWIAPTLVTPSPGNNGEDIHNLNWTYVAYCRYGIVILSGKGCIGSTPTS